MAGKSQELADALKRFTLYSMQQYRTRYLLARLTQHVEMAFSGLKVPGSLEPFTNLEIEHILPNKPEDDLRGKWVTENPGMVYDDYKNRLGNLTLLEKPINIVAGNDFYTAKQSEYSKSGNYLTRSLVALTDVGQNTSISRINAKLEAFPGWNAATIEKRHAMLIALAQDVWKTTPIDV
ncbi:HNH endonuclease family protein [Paucibacter sp. KCTC 42545]|uniref:HNH endonuclease family protein n=1 Tax=Paucibacter sp. KCTC 42545 TaxID=1768242 RepID=UPI000A9CDA96|nr:HNH endonuclease family protein [Paucibacter sp. KCTC 42545]